MVGDHSRQMETHICTGRGRRRWISLITNPLNCWAPVPLSQINMAPLENTSENLRQTSGDYPIYYIRTEKYSPKSCVVSFGTQMSSSQSEEWTVVFTREKSDTSNQNRERCFFTCEKNDTSNQSHRGVWVSRQNSRLFLQLAEHRFAHIRGEKFFSKSFFSLKKWKTFQKWSGIVSFVSLSIKKTVESRRNNSGRGKQNKT